MVGLGAFTSIVTVGGLTVADEGVPITSGNSYTAVASAEAIRKALALVGERESTPTAAVVGATGAIGRAMAMLLAEDVGRLILVGNPDSTSRQVRNRLLKRAGDVVRFVAARHADGAVFKPGSLAAEVLRHPGPPAAADEVVARLEQTGWLVLTQETKLAVRASRVVVTATSATGTLIRPEDFQPHAVVCDVSRPANVGREVTTARPDVLVLDGGVIAVPPGSVLSRFGLGDGLVYACMAETMMLTLAGHLENTSLGADLGSKPCNCSDHWPTSMASMSPSCAASASRWKTLLSGVGGKGSRLRLRTDAPTNSRKRADPLPPLSPVLGGEGSGVRGLLRVVVCRSPLTPDPSPPSTGERGEERFAPSGTDCCVGP